MKKVFLLVALAICSVCSAELSSNAVARLAKSRIGREVLREHLVQKRMEILGLNSKHTSSVPAMKDRYLEKVPTRKALGASQTLTARLDGWEYTVTTNDQGQITRIAQKGTNVVMMVWNDFVVPMRYRTVFPRMTDDERLMITGYVDDLRPWTERDPIDPFKDPKEEIRKNTDENITDEIREVQVRGW